MEEQRGCDWTEKSSTRPGEVAGDVGYAIGYAEAAKERVDDVGKLLKVSKFHKVQSTLQRIGHMTWFKLSCALPLKFRRVGFQMRLLTLLSHIWPWSPFHSLLSGLLSWFNIYSFVTSLTWLPANLNFAVNFMELRATPKILKDNQSQRDLSIPLLS